MSKQELYSIKADPLLCNVHDLHREYAIAYPDGTVHGIWLTGMSLVKAMNIINTPKLAERKLRETVPLLHRWLKLHFKNAVYDSLTNKLHGSDGYALNLKLRPRPDLPVAYRNQQTNTGNVEVYRHATE